MQCKWLYSTLLSRSLLDPRIKGSFLVSYGSDEIPILQAAKDVISSHYRTLCKNLHFSFLPLSIIQSTNLSFFYVKTERRQVVQKRTRERSKHKLQRVENILARCYQRFWNQDHHQGLAVSKVLDELDAYLKEPLVTNEAG